MTVKLSEIFIDPFTYIDGDRINTYAYGLEDTDADGWNVHSWGLFNWTAEIIHDEDFADLDAAVSYAKAISRQFDAQIVGLRQREAITPFDRQGIPASSRHRRPKRLPNDRRCALIVNGLGARSSPAT